VSEAPTSATYKRLRQYARPYWGLIGIGMLAMALEAAASAGTLKLLGPIVDDIFVDTIQLLVAGRHSDHCCAWAV
jgi:ABC-type multidrug transport system fused ATPase/permease subunit